MTFSDNRVPDVEATGSEYSEAVTDKGDTDRRGKHAVVKALGWKGEVRKSLASEEGVKLDRLMRRFRVPAAATTASSARQRRAGIAKIRAGMTLYSGERERERQRTLQQIPGNIQLGMFYFPPPLGLGLGLSCLVQVNLQCFSI